MRQQLGQSARVVVRAEIGDSRELSGVPAGTRTRNLLLRRQLLCPIELQGRIARSTANTQHHPPAHSPHTGFLRVHSSTYLMPQQVRGTP